MAHDTPHSEPDLGLLTVLREDGSADPAHDPVLSSELLLRMWREIKRLRMLETRMVMLQRQGRIGFYGACTGQEATPIAVGFALAPEDWVFPALRESAIMLVRGFPLASYVAQIFGNSRDVLKGRQMPSHMSARAVNQVSWSSCIGPQIPQAVGAAMAAKLRGDRVVTVGFMGDGATSQPDFHAAMTFAARYDAPCLLICQNNHWSISVPTSRQTASQTIAVKARAYGIPGVRVDGNDVLAVYAAVRDAADRARSGGGPTFLEHVTYRMGAHSTSDDPTRYRDSEEVERWAKKDPLDRFERYLKKSGVLEAAHVEREERAIEAEIAAAIDEVESAAPPPAASLFEDVYASPPQGLFFRVIVSHRSVSLPGTRARLATHAAVCSVYRAHVVERDHVVSEDALLLRAFGRRGVIGRPVLTVLLEGRARLSVGSVARWLTPGDVSVVPTKSAISMRQEGPRYRSVVLEWDASSPIHAGATGAFRTERLSPSALRAAASFAELVPAADGDSSRVAEGLSKLTQALEKAGLPVAVPKASALLEEVEPRTRELARALDALHSNLGGKPMLVDLDAALHLSSRQVNRVVAAYNERYGFNASGWRDTRNRWRLMMGATLMTTPGAVAEQVATAVGYSSGATFCRALSVSGLPPPGAIALAVSELA